MGVEFVIMGAGERWVGHNWRVLTDTEVVHGNTVVGADVPGQKTEQTRPTPNRQTEVQT